MISTNESDTSSVSGLIDSLSFALSEVTAPVDAAEMQVVQATERFVVIRISGESFAIPMSSLLEIQRIPAFTPLRGIADWLLGVTNFHGDVLSVVDPRPLLGFERLTTTDKSHRLIVLQSSRSPLHLGLVVDSTLGVRAIHAESIRPPNGNLSGSISRYLRGVCEFHDDLLAVLDIEQLIGDLTMHST